MTGPDEQIPGWAIELIRQVERLNEKIPSHVEWATRNILDLEKRTRELEQHNGADHEERLRSLEQFKWKSTGMATLISLVATLIATISWNIFK